MIEIKSTCDFSEITIQTQGKIHSPTRLRGRFHEVHEIDQHKTKIPKLCKLIKIPLYKETKLTCDFSKITDQTQGKIHSPTRLKGRFHEVHKIDNSLVIFSVFDNKNGKKRLVHHPLSCFNYFGIKILPIE